MPPAAVGRAPAVQAGPADTELQRGGDAVLLGGPHAADAEAQPREVLVAPRSGRPAAPRGQEEEARAFLVGVAKRTTVRIGACAWHANATHLITAMSH